MQCKIDNETYVDQVRINCVQKKGEKSGKCGKRYLREPFRHDIGKELATKGSELYRTEQAAKRMRPGDPEPPTLPSASVLRVAKVEFVHSTHAHQDSRKALEIMKYTSWSNAIHSIGYNPFFVHFWTAHQIRLVFNYRKSEISSDAMDASGNMIKKIELFDGIKTGPIFLYIIVVNNDAGQFIVAQMISAIHNTVAIQYFLEEWVRLGAPHPKEFTCDGAKALIIASIRVFTQYSTIEEYATACGSGDLPRHYIRMDVAHFLKLYVDFLSKLTNSKKVRVFYKASMGQLIQSQDMEMATKVLKAILIVSHCKTDGRLLGANEDTQCETHRQFLKGLIDPSELEAPIADAKTEEWQPIRPSDESIFEDTDRVENMWTQWFKRFTSARTCHLP